MMVIVYLVFLVLIYFSLYISNLKIREPEGCEQLRESCHSCRDVSCLANPVYKTRKE